MALRHPSEEIHIPNMEQLQPLKWHRIECELVTPMYGGGVQTATIDLKMPIRVSAIRGQLRFWWRLLAKHKWKLGDTKAIQNAEFSLWGGQGADEGGRASLVFLKVTDISNLNAQPWARYEPHYKGGFKTLPTAEDWANVPYVLFPAQGKKPESTDSKEPSTLIKAGLTWQLHLALAQNINEQQTDQVWETIRWWANFGGVGARTRRGLGAVRVIGQNISPISEDEAQAIGCKLVCCKSQSKAAYVAWSNSVSKLQRFRQGDAGRNPREGAPNPGRSYWPEPDAIRSITGQSSIKHSKRQTQGDFFPRAAFGLPIIFKFKDDGNSKNAEPAQSVLQPIVDGRLKERMASPIILRPYFNGQGWQAAVLCLPHQHIDNLQLKLIQGDHSFDVQYWDNQKSGEIKPIHQYAATNILDAFLKYFAQ